MTQQPPRSTMLVTLWMSGWLAAMVLIAIAAREAGKLLHVFQIMEIRSLNSPGRSGLRCLPL